QRSLKKHTEAGIIDLNNSPDKNRNSVFDHVYKYHRSILFKSSKCKMQRYKRLKEQ
ncbi:11148_t:CDS:1, partial [Gigaspora margarita]